ncbi:MAG: hypothetical protein R2857_10230 [Vampirovibrionales bacterium]
MPRSYGRLEQIISNTAESFLPEHSSDIVAAGQERRQKRPVRRNRRQPHSAPADRRQRYGQQACWATSTFRSPKRPAETGLSRPTCRNADPQTLYQSIRTHNLGEQYSSALQQNIDKLLPGQQRRCPSRPGNTGPEGRGPVTQEAMAALRASKDYVRCGSILFKNSKGLTRQSIELLPAPPAPRRTVVGTMAFASP